MLVCVFLNAFCTRDRGCSAHPAFPAPSCFLGVKIDAKLGRISPRECEVISGRHCEERLRRSNPAFLVAAKAGLLRFARNDVDGFSRISEAPLFYATALPRRVRQRRQNPRPRANALVKTFQV